jgi:hypothetical protein
MNKLILETLIFILDLLFTELELQGIRPGLRQKASQKVVKLRSELAKIEGGSICMCRFCVETRAKRAAQTPMETLQENADDS